VPLCPVRFARFRVSLAKAPPCDGGASTGGETWARSSGEGSPESAGETPAGHRGAHGEGAVPVVPIIVRPWGDSKPPEMLKRNQFSTKIAKLFERMVKKTQWLTTLIIRINSATANTTIKKSSPSGGRRTCQGIKVLAVAVLRGGPAGRRLHVLPPALQERPVVPVAGEGKAIWRDQEAGGRRWLVV